MITHIGIMTYLRHLADVFELFVNLRVRATLHRARSRHNDGLSSLCARLPSRGECDVGKLAGPHKVAVEL